MKAIVLFSGGQDSCTVLEDAVRFHGAANVTALSVIYGQRHAVELECAQAYTAGLGVKHQIIDATFFGQLAPSALTGEGDTSDPHPFIPNVPASFVPNRNAFMLTLAHSIAQATGAGTIYGGMCQTDYSGYPDCRDVFIAGMEHALNVGSASSIEIVTPLMNLTKAETWLLADSLGALERVRLGSHTCYNGDHSTLHDHGYGCGQCPACQLRAKGWAEFQAARA